MDGGLKSVQNRPERVRAPSNLVQTGWDGELRRDARRDLMRARRGLFASVAAIAISAFLIGTPMPVLAQQTVAIDNDDIGGVVRGPGGPEAGVWVIAETTDLPTRYIKSVVTDDQGRYVIPDLPTANYKVWARGYGLADTAKVKSEPGKIVNFTAAAAAAKAAAEIYPAIYWYSMLKTPGK